MTMEKLLFSIISSISYKILTPILDAKYKENPTVTGLSFDSRKTESGNLFFALEGLHTNGKFFIPQAIIQGASAIVYSGDLAQDILDCIKKSLQGASGTLPTFVQVDNVQTCMAQVSSAFYDFPSSKLVVIGVTGTEGKSSTVSFIWQILKKLGFCCGFLSTVEYCLDGKNSLPNPDHETTSEAPLIQKRLYTMVENGVEYAIVEASSHGLSDKLNRLGCVEFDIGIFMNVTLEHLEFHGTFEQYRSDKANLFRKVSSANHNKIIANKSLTITPCCILNAQDKSACFFRECSKVKTYGFAVDSLKESESTQCTLPDTQMVFAENANCDMAGVEFDLRGKLNCHVATKTPGAFNIYNITCAMLAVSHITKFSDFTIAKAAECLQSITGRMTRLAHSQPYEVIVDYAHTPSSFLAIMPSIKKQCKGKVIAVFGSGGERDTTKRPLQGEVAATYCDIIILTDEDPRGEDSMAILQMIAKGCYTKGKIKNKDIFFECDRKKAIRKALDIAKENDIVLLLGKSHEKSIIYKDRIMPYNEIQEATLALKERGYI